MKEKKRGVAFEVQDTEDGTRFIAELDIGSEADIIGCILDFVFSVFFQGRLEAIKQHMAEEGLNLKAILEKDALAGTNAV